MLLKKAFLCLQFYNTTLSCCMGGLGLIRKPERVLNVLRTSLKAYGPVQIPLSQYLLLFPLTQSSSSWRKRGLRLTQQWLEGWWLGHWDYSAKPSGAQAKKCQNQKTSTCQSEVDHPEWLGVMVLGVQLLKLCSPTVGLVCDVILGGGRCFCSRERGGWWLC